MKILYHHRTRAEDAQGIHIAELVKAFRELGHQVNIVSLVGRNVAADGKDTTSWHQHFQRLPNWLYEIIALSYNIYGLWLLACSIKKEKPDLIYERYALNTFCGIWASRYFRIPLVLEVNAPLYYEQVKLGKLTFKAVTKFLERWVCSNATATITVSSSMKEILVQEGVLGKQITVMPNGIDPALFNPEISGQAVRNRYHLGAKIVIGFVGWFRPWHGLEALLEILREKGFEPDKSHLLLVGDGPAYADLYEYAKRHALLSAVTFTGAIRRRDIPEYIAAMDIAVQPSAPEYACPMKIIEYMGMGKCIVAPNQPNIREIIADNVNGYLFETGNRHSLQRILLRLIADPQLRNATGKNALKTIFDRGFLWRSNASKVVSLVGGNPGCINSALPGCDSSTNLAHGQSQD
jgi:glycosyltransferase involved in cell wall biosynthesis